MKSHLVISLTKSKYRKSFNLDLWILNPILSRSNGQTIKRGSQSKPTGNHPHEGRDNHADHFEDDAKRFSLESQHFEKDFI